MIAVKERSSTIFCSDKEQIQWRIKGKGIERRSTYDFVQY